MPLSCPIVLTSLCEEEWSHLRIADATLIVSLELFRMFQTTASLKTWERICPSPLEQLVHVQSPGTTRIRGGQGMAKNHEWQRVLSQLQVETCMRCMRCVVLGAKPWQFMWALHLEVTAIWTQQLTRRRRHPWTASARACKLVPRVNLHMIIMESAGTIFKILLMSTQLRSTVAASDRCTRVVLLHELVDWL